MLTDDETMYLVNLKDVQKVIKRDKRYAEAGYTAEMVQRAMKENYADFSDEKGTMYWKLPYTGDYEQAVKDFLAK